MKQVTCVVHIKANPARLRDFMLMLDEDQDVVTVESDIAKGPDGEEYMRVCAMWPEEDERLLLFLADELHRLHDVEELQP